MSGPASPLPGNFFCRQASIPHASIIQMRLVSAWLARSMNSFGFVSMPAVHLSAGAILPPGRKSRLGQLRRGEDTPHLYARFSGVIQSATGLRVRYEMEYTGGRASSLGGLFLASRPCVPCPAQTGSAGASPSRLVLSPADQRDRLAPSHFELHPRFSAK
jgi:hypothetical protein